MDAALSIFVNGMMAVLLLITIVYCWRLNNRIRILQDSKSELARIIREFNESTERATQSILEIHAATDRISENIQHKIDKANFLATDLDMLIEKGGRLTGNTPAARGEAPSRPGAGHRVVDAVGRAARSPSAMEAAAGNVGRVTPLADSNPEPVRRQGGRAPSRAEQDIAQALQSRKDGR